MTASWEPAKIADLLSSFFLKQVGKAPRRQANAVYEDEAPTTTIDVLITFDRSGISKHPNHTSLYHGAVAWLKTLMKGRTGWECPVTLYTLTSTNVLRKYLSVLDAPMTLLHGMLHSMSAAGRRGESVLPLRLMFLSNGPQYLRAQQAMTQAHKSQMRWFRWGWIIVSRYMVINDLRREKI